MSAFNNRKGSLIMDRMIVAIQKNKQYLSDIDGAIGDGDHGVNMNKGFTMTREALDKDPGDFSHGLITLARILIMRIGGSMGPLYGTLFKTMGKALAGSEEINGQHFLEALRGVKDRMEALTPAKVGDKTMVDALYPAIDAYCESFGEDGDFAASLTAMKLAAEKGRDDTNEMVAQLGRSSRLGERSRGVVDAGAASCALLLGEMADAIQELL